MKKKICLNMIVKDESAVIRRCLDSVISMIDYWVIVDTGSKDGTQKIITEHLRGIPGELHERPWVHFGHNRNEAMQLARGKGDFLLFIDAEDRLVFSKDFVLPPLEADMYSIFQKEGIGGTFREHHVYLLARNNTDLEWKGPIHEYLACPTDKRQAMLEGVYCDYINDGSRSKDPKKCEKDIQVLKKAALENPMDTRSVFYLARTYWSIRDHENAIFWFRRRVEMGADPLEVYYSLLYIGLGQKAQKKAPEIFLDSFKKAYLYRPTRTEAIYEMGRYYVEASEHLLGYAILRVAREIPHSMDNLFVETWVNDWGIPLFLFLAALHVRGREEIADLLQDLLENPTLPENLRKQYQLERWKDQLLQA